MRALIASVYKRITPSRKSPPSYETMSTWRHFNCVTCGVYCDDDDGEDGDADDFYEVCGRCDLVCEENGCANGVGLRTGEYDRDEQTCEQCGMVVCVECVSHHHDACLLSGRRRQSCI